MSSCIRPTITWPRALISSVLPYTSATQLNACCGGVMLSPRDANSTIGTLIWRRSKTPLGPDFTVPDHTLLPTKRFCVIHSISSRFMRK